MPPRYTVRTDKIPEQLRVRFFVAWINDAKHPDDITEGASCAWFMALDDAHRVCDALNVSDRLTQAQRVDALIAARDGYAFMRVLTPQVAEEYEIPIKGKLTGEDLRNYERLQDLAEIHRTSISSSTYRTL